MGCDHSTAFNSNQGSSRRQSSTRNSVTGHQIARLRAAKRMGALSRNLVPGYRISPDEAYSRNQSVGGSTQGCCVGCAGPGRATQLRRPTGVRFCLAESHNRARRSQNRCWFWPNLHVICCLPARPAGMEVAVTLRYGQEDSCKHSGRTCVMPHD
jgi:hypothetical protein